MDRHVMRTGLSLGAAALALAFGLSAHAAGAAGAEAYLAKGQLSLIHGKAGAAAADREKAIKLKPTNAYNVLWLHFARNKEGAPDQVELQLNADRVNRADWPGPLLDYLTGKIDASAVLAKAGEGDDEARASRLCEANLFVGQDDLTKARRSEGLERLQAAADACAASSREAQLARADLPGAAPAPPKPVLTAASDPPRVAKFLLADPMVRPASIGSDLLEPPPVKPAPIRSQAAGPQPIRPQPARLQPVRPETIKSVALTTRAPGDPLLRGSLR